MALPLDYVIYLFLTPILVLGETFTLVRLFQLRTIYQARLLFLCVFLGFTWLNSDILRIVLLDEELKYFFAIVSHTAIILIGPTLILLTLGVVNDQNSMPKKSYFLFYLPGLIFWIVLLTNPYHQLYFEETFPQRKGEFTVIGLEYGPAFWAMVTLSFSYIGWSLFDFFYTLYNQEKSISRRNVLLLIVAIILPFISESIYLSGIVTEWDKDLAPIFYGFSVSIIHKAFRPKYREKMRKKLENEERRARLT